MWVCASILLFAMDVPTGSSTTGDGDPVVPAVVVLDFDGAELRRVPGEPSDPDALTTPFAECEGPWPPFGDATRETELLGRVRELFAPFAVSVTTEIPQCRPYIRVLVGPSTGCGKGVGYADPGCDRTVGDGIVFAKIGGDDHRSAAQQAVIIAHEIGHALGLAHVDNSSDVMNATVGDPAKTFVDVCSELDDTFTGNVCPLIGQCRIDDRPGQNAHDGLVSAYGLASEVASRDRCVDRDAQGPGCACRPSPDLPAAAPLLALVLAAGRRGRG